MRHATGNVPRVVFVWAATFALVGWLVLPLSGRTAAAEEQSESQLENSSAIPAPSVVEARARARILHETIHATLQVVHRDFFIEDETAIPSRSLDDVFLELERLHDVKMRWLAVNADAMNVDHEPQNAFEVAAAKAIASGSDEFEAVSGELYRLVGRIQLPSQCLKCHVAGRTSTEDRAAGLIISMPLKPTTRE